MQEHIDTQNTPAQWDTHTAIENTIPYKSDMIRWDLQESSLACGE